MNLPKYKKSLFFLLVVGICVATAWMVSPANGFIFDDYSNLVMAITNSPADMFTLLPLSRYNDRPVGRILIGLLYNQFKFNPQLYIVVFVLIHCLNTLLVFKISEIIFQKTNAANVFNMQIIACAIFAVYPQSIMTVQWISAVFDILCCTFTLISLYAFLKKDESDTYRAFYTIIAIVAYIISLRTKEMSLLLPVFFVFYELAYCDKEKWWKSASAASLISTVWMIIYLVRLMTYPTIDSGEYQQQFTITTLFLNLVHYIQLYFDLQGGAMSFSGYNWCFVPGLLLLFTVMARGVHSAFKKNSTTLLLVCAVGLMLAPVLTMSEMQHKLYLYIPSVFIAMMIASTLYGLGKESYKATILTAVIMLLLITTNFAKGPQQYKNWWCSMVNQDKIQLQQIHRLGDLPRNTTVYAKGVKEEYNVIHPYGPGNSLKILYDDMSIKCEAVDVFPADPLKPYVLWEYTNGKFTEIERVFENEIRIEEIACYKQSDMTYTFSIYCTPIEKDVVILIDGVQYSTVVGDTFISTIYEHTNNKNKTVKISLYSSDLGVTSESVEYCIP